MSKTAKPKKKVIARFIGKGFYLKGDKIGQKSHVVYTDKDIFIASEGDDFVNELLAPFFHGIEKALTSNRIKPESLRITFHILEK